MSHGLILTVIGSYPVNIEGMDFMRQYWDSLTTPSWNEPITRAVNDMVSAGVQLVSDGQTRDPFVTIFARGLKGCRIRDRPEIIDKLEHDHPITKEDLQFVRTILPKNAKLLGLIVGPHTLSQTVADQHYHDKKRLAFDAAEALHKEAVAIEPSVDVISVDEPHFSTSFPSYGQELIETVVDGISIPKRLHVCGDVSDIIPQLLDMPVDILSHEFKATPALFDRFQEYPDTSKQFCIGSVRSDSYIVESVCEISDHITKALDVFGKNVSQLSPDCGLRFLPRNIAMGKLKNLYEAMEEMVNDQGNPRDTR